MRKRNIYKIVSPAIPLPPPVFEPDGGLKRCATPFMALADPDTEDKYRNDITGVAMICDTLTVELEKEDGTLVPAFGTTVSFPRQPNAKGFIIDWRQHLPNVGCYKVKVSYSIASITGYYYLGAFQLQRYTDRAAIGTVQLYTSIEDTVEPIGINFIDSGFMDSIRFRGEVVNSQPNTVIENIIHTDLAERLVVRQAKYTHELITSPLPVCYLDRLRDWHIMPHATTLVSYLYPLAHRNLQEVAMLMSEDGFEYIYNQSEKAQIKAILSDKKHDKVVYYK
jgi:hypothetical protein